jgi:DNA-binding MarR family transcriptional regulator
MQNKIFDALFIRAPRLNQFNILNQLASNPRLTQAELARRCDLSVAMVNNYMKELCSTGLVEYRRRSSKSISYHLTPSGKGQLQTIQAELLHEMVGIFAEAKERIRDRILVNAEGVLQRVLLFGNGHLAELAFHALELAKVTVIGICDDDPDRIGKEWCGRQVINPSQIRYMAPDAVVVASREKTTEICDSLTHLLDRGIRVLRLDGGASNEIKLPEVKVETAVQAVTGKQ